MTYLPEKVRVTGKCFRSMRKNETPHILEIFVKLENKCITGKCSCVAGASGYCHHIIGLLFYMAHCKMVGLSSLPDDLTCTSIPQRWSVPREKHIKTNEIQSVLVKKPRMGANYDRFVKSTLYSPSMYYGILCKNDFSGLDPLPLVADISPTAEQRQNLTFAQTKFGNAPKGSPLSYQQKLSQEYIINDFLACDFPKIPLEDAGERIMNNVQVCLNSAKNAALDSLSVTRAVAIDLEERTVTQSASTLWQLLRSKRITASKFGSCAKRISNFENLVKQINPSRHVVTAAMRRGIEMESHAAAVYANVAKSGMVNVYPSGLVINPKCPWLGCSPDRKVYDIQAASQGRNPFGLCEIKVVQEGETDFKNVRYLQVDPFSNEITIKRNHDYYFQVQCQLALTGLEWCDFFCLMNDNKYFCERIYFDKDFFQDSKDKVDMFFFNYFLSA